MAAQVSDAADEIVHKADRQMAIASATRGLSVTVNGRPATASTLPPVEINSHSKEVEQCADAAGGIKSPIAGPHRFPCGSCKASRIINNLLKVL